MITLILFIGKAVIIGFVFAFCSLILDAVISFSECFKTPEVKNSEIKKD